MKNHLKTEKPKLSNWALLEFTIYVISRMFAGMLEALLRLDFNWKDGPNLYLTVNCVAVMSTVAVVFLCRNLFKYKKENDSLFSAKTLFIFFGFALTALFILLVWRFR